MSFPDTLMRLVRRNLSSLPSPLARLVYFASLHDSYTGRYLHEGWGTIATPEEVNRVVRQTHLEIFDNVLELKLEALCRELQEHFQSLNGSIGEMAAMWRKAEPFRDMLPLDCSPVERALFISQMRIALGILAISPDLAVLAERAA